jgi:hypothetical protein
MRRSCELAEPRAFSKRSTGTRASQWSGHDNALNNAVIKSGLTMMIWPQIVATEEIVTDRQSWSSEWELVWAVKQLQKSSSR